MGGYSGMRVEVLTPENELLFVARFAVGAGGVVELQQISENSVTLAEEPMRVNIRGYDQEQRTAVHIEGEISALSGSVWRAQGLRVVSKDNDRAFFRQGTDADGAVMQIGQVGTTAADCEVVNISASGVCIRTKERYEVGDKLLLRSKLLPSMELSPLLCAVCRVTEKRGGVCEYGCRFVDLNEGMENQIAKSIAEMQMKRLKR